MKKILLILSFILFTSCKDSFIEGYLIVESTSSTNRNYTSYPQYRYYITFKNSHNTKIGLLTNTNYKVGDTLK
jgi:hypothetical protein